jgi:DNA-binding transcriptional regulator YiaG
MNVLELKNIRKEYNITQEKLAEIVGSSVRAVQSWEQGQRKMPQSAIKLLSFFLKEKGVDVDILPLSPSQQKNILKKLKKL